MNAERYGGDRTSVGWRRHARTHAHTHTHTCHVETHVEDMVRPQVVWQLQSGCGEDARDTRTAHGARGQQVGKKAGLGIAHPRRSKGGLTLSARTTSMTPVLRLYLYSSSAAMAAHTNASASTPWLSLLLCSCHPRVCARDGLHCVHLVPFCPLSCGCGGPSAGRTFMIRWQISSWV